VQNDDVGKFINLFLNSVHCINLCQQVILIGTYIFRYIIFNALCELSSLLVQNNNTCCNFVVGVSPLYVRNSN